jgi:hypothetical protein
VRFHPSYWRTSIKMCRVSLAAFLMMSAWSATELYAQSRGIPLGEGQFEVDAPPGPVTVYSYRPASFSATSPIWIVIHGARRHTTEHIRFDYYDVWAPLAEHHGALLLLPAFLERKWPSSWQFQLGNVRTPSLKPIAWEETGFAVAEQAFRQAVAITGSARRGFSLYGHGAGAQWVQRYVLHGGGRYVDRAVAANPGWYLVPDDEFDYPYGLKGAPIPESTLRQAFLLQAGNIGRPAYGSPVRLEHTRSARCGP